LVGRQQLGAVLMVEHSLGDAVVAEQGLAMALAQIDETGQGFLFRPAGGAELPHE
jgi:hypothetical protein